MIYLQRGVNNLKKVYKYKMIKIIVQILKELFALKKEKKILDKSFTVATNTIESLSKKLREEHREYFSGWKSPPEQILGEGSSPPLTRSSARETMVQLSKTCFRGGRGLAKKHT